MTDEKLQKLKELFSDQNFIIELFKKETMEDAKTFLKEKGIEFSDSDMESLRELLYETIKNKRNLSENELDHISGGKSIGDMTLRDLKNTAIITAVVAAPIALDVCGGYLIYDSTKRSSRTATAAEAVAGATVIGAGLVTGSWVLIGAALAGCAGLR